MALTTQHLNCYILPGRITDARVGLGQAQQAEQLGFGSVFAAERWESKETGSILGALSQATSRITLVAGLTHFGTRHPLVQAGLGATMQNLSNGRFVLGYGRSIPSDFRKQGIPVLTNAGMADFATILRELWSGKTVSYHGPAGDYPEMKLGNPCMNPPPIILGAIGPKTLALAGSHFDGVVLHPFLTTDGVARSATIVRDAARAAGRDPAKIKIYATIVVALDSLSPEERADILEARAVSYFMHHEVGLVIARANGWDEAPVRRLIETGISSLEYAKGAADVRMRLASMVEMIPETWLTTGTAVGSVAHCLRRLGEYLDAGADQILIHGAAPKHQISLVNGLSPTPG